MDSGTSPITLNATITGLKFLFDVTLGHGDVLAKMHSVRVPHIIPVVLNKQEVDRLIACAGNLKHQTALSLAYGTGLRAHAVISLRVTDTGRQSLIANNGRKEKLALVRQLLNVVPAATIKVTGDATAPDESKRPNFVCERCGTQMIVIESFVRGQIFVRHL